MKLLAKILFILSPSLLIVGLLTWLVFHIGEFLPITDAVKMQLHNPELIYDAEGNFSEYKWEMLRYRDPSLLILGSSRVMALRSEFFNLKPDDIYNAGMRIVNIWRINWILESLEDESRLPDVLIVGLDHDWFVPGRAAPNAVNNIAIKDETYHPPDLASLLNRTRRVIDVVWDDPANLWAMVLRRESYYELPAIGLRAITQGSGFRYDGSHLNNIDSLNTLPNSMRFANVRKLIAANTERFSQSDVPDPDAFDAVRQLIEFCAERDIELVAFSPPYAPTIYEEMVATEKYDYIPKMHSELETIFAESPFTYVDFTDGHIANTDDRNFIDGNHGSEFVYLNLYLVLLDTTSSVLSAYSDMDYLEPFAKTPSPHSAFEVFDVAP